MKIFVLHENPDWLPPLATALDAAGAPWEEWVLTERAVDLSIAPPSGIFYNRMSASSHTRGHRFSPELTSVVLAWLIQHGRRVINGPSALDLEVSKVRQYAALARAGVRTPRTVAVVGKHLLEQAARSAFPEGGFILKPNRGGKGLGVTLVESPHDLAVRVAAPDFPEPLDGVYLLQEYIDAPEPVITRAEFVGGQYLYAVEVSTTGGFELCPADVCAAPGARPPFRVIEAIDPDLKRRLEHFLQIAGIDVAGIEFATGRDGAPLVYDVNTNTNYNAEAEAAAGLAVTGMGAIASYLGRELQKLRRQAA
jgi:glutathione synthase/RimK-type ligase-like ATP-grasp enzyme